ncbi:magnesium transporter MgtE [Arthrobacter sp. Hiyo8]|nr:magnesium transporter MgtE [Arthrobacter sp. Hiyo8]
MSTNPSRIFVARLLGLDVFDPLGDRLGRLRDVVVLSRGLRGAPHAVGIVVEVPGKKRVFVPMTRLTSMDQSQIICTGLVNLRRFQQRGAEQLVVGELFDRKVTLKDGSGDAIIEDIAMDQQRNGDWLVSKLFIRRGTSTSRLRGLRRGHTLLVDWADTLQGSENDPQGASHFVATHEDLKPADFADALQEMSDKRRIEVASELQDERLADVLQELPEEDQVTLLSALDNERAADVLEEMDPDDAADLLADLPSAKAEELLLLMEPDEADDVRRLLQYDEDTAGGLMTRFPSSFHRKPRWPRHLPMCAARSSPRPGLGHLHLPPAVGDTDGTIPRRRAYPAIAPQRPARTAGQHRGQEPGAGFRSRQRQRGQPHHGLLQPQLPPGRE